LVRELGRYTLEKRVSQTDRGEVYLAIDGMSGMRCIVKTIARSFTDEPEFAPCFEHELRTLQGIVHPNIARVLDGGIVNGEYYFVLDYVHGRDLGDVLDRAFMRSERLPMGIGLLVAIEVLTGLEHVHSLGLVHRDISPTNVMVGFDGSVKLIDFGWTAGERLPERARRKLVVASYAYMPPEQARLEPLDGRADLYSLAVLLFEVFTGVRLVDDTADLPVLHEQALDPHPKKPSAVIASVPEEIDRLLMAALEPNASDRYSSASDMKRFALNLETRPSTRGALVDYLRVLYSDADRMEAPHR
jgi:serine/threonine-protein kinase